MQSHYSSTVAPAVSGSVAELSAASSALLALIRAAEDSITAVLRKSVDTFMTQVGHGMFRIQLFEPAAATSYVPALCMGGTVWTPVGPHRCSTHMMWQLQTTLPAGRAAAATKPRVQRAVVTCQTWLVNVTCRTPQQTPTNRLQHSTVVDILVFITAAVVACFGADGACADKRATPL